MGRDKSLLTLTGSPLIFLAVKTLRSAGLPASIAGATLPSRTSIEPFAPVIEDAEPGLGPLSGICAAISSSEARHAIFLSVDTPFLPPSLLTALLHYARITERPITLPSVNGFVQTFPVVISRSALPALKQTLHLTNRGCFSAFQTAAAGLGQAITSVAVEFLFQAGHVAHPSGLPPAFWFLNLNTQQELSRAEALAAKFAA
jgi:molybdopterin-guanine dinucleotide biosynthesis protein A